MTGFTHPSYAESLREIGIPHALPRCDGWILKRSIAGTQYHDAMGCYPLFACRDWSRLCEDVAELRRGDLVTLALVTDPFGDYDEPYLRSCFDTVLPFKQHYVVDLSRPPNEVVSKHHRYYARKALRELSVERHPHPPAYLDEWMGLHGHLVAKHQITGLRRLSRQAFAMQLALPDMVVLRAVRAEEPVAGMLFLTQGPTVYAHVLGCSASGYESGALYAILWSAIHLFAESFLWLDIMGVPGLTDAGAAGIRQFKRGWTHETRTAWFCGAVLDHARYTEVLRRTKSAESTYFPAYRDGEMA